MHFKAVLSNQIIYSHTDVSNSSQVEHLAHILHGEVQISAAGSKKNKSILLSAPGQDA